ncbi:hypothetical protein [Microbacterium sp. H1-D42]|uniref:hypothetical protein n=1 Tax=Microbacterium sp. H1-D42 TaxID=2925844 RepID=UPI001F52CE51|nr:hypothetical protein [Microbacterium sp. H1-D42]UNK70067.1 hypothetical protein MNR00_12960 [Microbacterium sp. H1-D42]
MTTQEPIASPPSAGPSHPQPGPQAHVQPAAPAYAQPVAAPAPAAPAGGLAIAGLILAFVAAPIGLVLSIVALVKRKRGGASIGLPLTGVIISALFIIGTITAIVIAVSMLTQVAAICTELGPGVWESGGVTYTCG